MNRILLIARREFLSTVRRKGFLFITFGFPIFLAPVYAAAGSAAVALPFGFAILFILAVMSSAGYLMHGISEEKENRIVEILISSVTPNQLLAGKILGLGAAGLTQVGIWILIGAIPASQFFPFLDMRWDQLFAAMVFFPLGFFLYGSLVGGSAALCNNFRESQQASLVWALFCIVPFFVMPSIVSQPNGTLARVLSYIPLTAPLTMMMRIGADKVPWWDMGLSIALQIAGLALFIRLGARLFRLGTLMYGKRPSLVDIVLWVKKA
jgi:ABC-2 type transport system permease protein